LVGKTLEVYVRKFGAVASREQQGRCRAAVCTLYCAHCPPTHTGEAELRMVY